MKRIPNSDSVKRIPSFKETLPKREHTPMNQLDKLLTYNQPSNIPFNLSTNLPHQITSNSFVSRSNQNMNLQNINEQGCSNHPNKQGAYEIQLDDSIQIYCEKCAILLASQGFKAERIVRTSTPVPKRFCSKRNSFDQIFILAQETSRLLSSKKIQLKECKQQAQTMIFGQYQNLNKYFSSLEAMIAYQKNLYIEYLNQEQRQVQIVHSSLEKILEVSLRDVNKTKREIMQSINESDKGKDVTLRLQQYKMALQECKKVAFRWERTEIMPKPVIENVESILQMVDLRIQKRENGRQEGTMLSNNINFSFDLEKRNHRKCQSYTE